MKANKKGISLIVLIITIVVIIILAATIILSITKSNPIRNANRAVDQSDMKTAQEAFILWLGDRWAQPALQYEVGCYYNGTVTAKGGDNLLYKFERFTDDDTTGKTVDIAATKTDDNGAWQTTGTPQPFSTADFGLEQFDQIVWRHLWTDDKGKHEKPSFKPL